MSGTFTKSILKVGSYHSPDGVVEVTPSRLKHWEAETKRLQSVGYAIPSHFDHSNEIDLLEPIAMDVLQRQQDRSAKATVGRLESFNVAPDGKSAELTIQTLTPTAREVVENNAVFVSPVIFPEWKDGQGNIYRDVITSFDLVDHPVDSSQSSFVPALRMGINSQPYKLRVVKMSEDRGKPTAYFTNAEGATVPIFAGKKRDKKARSGRMKSKSSRKRMSLIRMSAEDDLPTDVKPEDSITDESYDSLDEVLDLLSEFGVNLPDDTDDASLLGNLKAALTALIGDKADEANPEDANPEQVNPMMATMSLRIKQLEETQLSAHREKVNGELQSALKEGRCTPAEVDKYKRVLGAVKLSLGADGKASKTSVDEFIEARAAVPKGTFWTDEQRTANPTRMSVVDAPESWDTNSKQLSDKQLDEAVAALRRKK